MQDLAVRNQIQDIEKKMSKMDGAMFGDCCPLEHTFVDGAYVRKIIMPKGILIVSKLHKITHPYFVMRGEVSVLTETGFQKIKAPYAGITQAGTKRVLYCHTEVEWITVHVTKERDLAKIEEEVIAKDYSELTKEETKFVDAFIGVMK